MDIEKLPVGTTVAEGDATPSPITLKDVLQAIFLPPQEIESPARSFAPALRPVRLWPAQTEETLGIGKVPLAETPVGPPRVDYTLDPIKPLTDFSTTRMAALVVGTGVVLAIVYMAQMTLKGGSGGFAATALVVLAGLVWLGMLLFEFAPPDGALLRRGPRVSGNVGYGVAEITGTLSVIRGAALLLAIPLSIATYVLTANNTFTPPGLVAWIASVMLWLIVAAQREPHQWFAEARQWLVEASRTLPAILKRRWPSVAASVLILGIAIFFRVYKLDSVPNEMTSDHVEKLLDAYDVSQGIYHVFFTRNGGREAIQFYLVALAAKLFGTGMSFLTLKLVSVLEGLALIPLVILFGREMVDQETGLIAGALVAMAWWHVVLSRLALRIVLTPVVFTLVLIALVRGIRTGSRKAWLWAGIWMGIGVYAYQAMRIVPLVAVSAFAVAIAGPVISAVRAHRQNRSDAPLRRQVAANVVARQTLNLLLAGLIALAIFVPMMRAWHDYPEQFWNRVINRTTNAERRIEGQALDVFVDNYRKALGMFNVRGDVAWISAVPNEPVLDTVTGGLLILGCMAWGVRVLVRRDPADVFVVFAALIMLLPSALAIAFPIENPSTTRTSGVIPIVFLLAAWPLALIGQRWRAGLGHGLGAVLGGLLTAILLGTAAQMNFAAYFTRYYESYRQAALNPSEVATAVRTVVGPGATLDGVWLQGWPFWHDYRAIGIEAGDIAFHNAIVDVPTLESYLRDFPQSFAPRPLVFIVHPADAEAINVLRGQFPTGYLDFHRGTVEGRSFYLYIVPSE